MEKLSRGEKEGDKLTTRYHQTELDFIEKYSNMMGIAPSVFQRLWTMAGCAMCESLNVEGELDHFFQHGSFLTLRSSVHRPFIDGTLPLHTKHFFEQLMDEVESKTMMKGGNTNGINRDKEE